MEKKDFYIQLDNNDNVAICISDYEDIKFGQRFALRDIPKDEYLYQYGYTFAKSQGIKKYEIISTSNTTNDIISSTNVEFVAPETTKKIEKYLNKSFKGYKRADNKVGTRNYIVIIPTSMCASEVASQVAKYFDNEIDKYENVDGVVALAHTEGCGCSAGMQIDRTMNVLKNFALHQNVSAALFIDLGCEQTSYDVMSEYLNKDITTTKPIKWITIQEHGTQECMNKSIEIVNEFLQLANKCKREDVPLSALVLGTECGASDKFSGISANPLIGSIADKIIYSGGKAILSEVPEMLGVYDMFFKRFASMEVADKFEEAVNWYIDLANRLNVNITNNLVPANINGGLINSYIKSLGAVMKGGTTTIEDVVGYGQELQKDGLSIMQGPGNDLESVTGLVSSGANIICFSTGYGTITGNAIVPTIKISSNSEMFNRLKDDMDFNAGKIIEGYDFDNLSEELLQQVIDVASGKQTHSERFKQRQFQIWTAGKLTL